VVIDGFPIPSIETLTPVGLYILLVLLMFFERIVPIGRVRAEQATTAYWRDAAEKKQATIDKQADALRILAEGVGTTVEKVMTTIQDKAEVDK
jgi:hypothetical protein